MHDRCWGQCAVRCLAEFQPNMRAVSWKTQGEKKCIYVHARLSPARISVNQSRPSPILRDQKSVFSARRGKRRIHNVPCEIFTEPLRRIYRNVRKDRRRSIIEAVERETRWNARGWKKRGKTMWFSLLNSIFIFPFPGRICKNQAGCCAGVFNYPL